MTTVREAMIGVLEEYQPITNWRALTGRRGLLEDLVAAVEGAVTIRDLDMTRSENIVTVRRGADISYLAAFVGRAYHHGESLHLTVDDGHLKVKTGSGSWSAPIETEVYEP